VNIVHNPYGTDAPYFVGPDERIPRDPVGGDMVGAGFLTQPGGAAESVQLCWTRNGRPQPPILGRPVAQGSDADRWLCELGVVEAGDTVEYWIVAGDGQTIESPRYSFIARRWRRLAQVAAVEAARDTLRLYLPQGRWYDLWDSTAYDGGCWIEVAAPLARIPIFVRAGAALPLRLGTARALDDVGNTVDQDDGLNLWLYPFGQASTTLLDAHGSSLTIQVAQATDGAVVVSLPPLNIPLTLRLPDGTTRQVEASQATQRVRFG